MLDSLDQRGRLHVSATHAERVDLAIDYLKAYRDSGRSAKDVRLLFDSSNRSVDEANRHVQQDRIRRGELTSHAITVESRSEDRRWKLHEHDLVMFLRPHKCGQTFVPNGTTGTVVGINTIRNTVSVELDQAATSRQRSNGDRIRPKIVELRLTPSAEHQPLGLAYAVHTAKFQGSEVAVVLAVPGGAGQTNRNSAYSTLTRCVEEAHVFADHETHGSNAIETLKGAWAMSSDKRTATSRQAPDAAKTASAPSKRPAGHRQDHEPRARAARAYEYALERMAGPELAGRITQAPAYPTLLSRLETLKANEASDRDMLARAVRQHQLETARDPAAALVYRLDRMPPIPAESLSLGLNRPADPAQERRDHSAPQRVNGEARDRIIRDTPGGVPDRSGPESQSDSAMRRALELGADAESRRSARERNEPTQAKDNDQSIGREIS